MRTLTRWFRPVSETTEAQAELVRCGSVKLRVGAQRSNSATPRNQMVTRARFAGERSSPSACHCVGLEAAPDHVATGAE